MSNILSVIDDTTLIEQYADPRNGSIGQLARFYGVSYGAMYSRLSSDDSMWTRAQTLRAQRLHELAIETVYADPERMIDQGGNDRIDPGSVSLNKMRAQEASRLAGILDQRLSERHVLALSTTGALADYMANVMSKGSSIPIAPTAAAAITAPIDTHIINGAYETILNNEAPIDPRGSMHSA